MGATNQTPILGLPQFVSTDKPQWLGDINGAFSLVDAFAGKTNGDVTAAANKAEAAQTAAQTASSSITTLQGVVDTQAGEISGLQTSVSSLQSDINTANSNITYLQNRVENITLAQAIRCLTISSASWTNNSAYAILFSGESETSTPLLLIPSIITHNAINWFTYPIGSNNYGASTVIKLEGNPLSLPIAISIPAELQTFQVYCVGSFAQEPYPYGVGGNSTGLVLAWVYQQNGIIQTYLSLAVTDFVNNDRHSFIVCGKTLETITVRRNSSSFIV